MSIGKIELRVYRGKSKITNPKCIYIERARSDVINVEQENKFKSALCTAHILQSIHFHNGYRGGCGSCFYGMVHVLNIAREKRYRPF